MRQTATRSLLTARAVAGAVSCCRGTSAVEFGLIGPLIALLLVGLVDVGQYAYQRVDMYSAARSGSQYFMAGGADLQEARNIIQASWTDAPDDAVISVDRFCQCQIVLSACNAPCPDGEPPTTYTRIALSGTYSGLVTSIPNRTSDLIRIR